MSVTSALRAAKTNGRFAALLRYLRDYYRSERRRSAPIVATPADRLDVIGLRVIAVIVDHRSAAAVSAGLPVRARHLPTLDGQIHGGDGAVLEPLPDRSSERALGSFHRGLLQRGHRYTRAFRATHLWPHRWHRSGVILTFMGSLLIVGHADTVRYT